MSIVSYLSSNWGLLLLLTGLIMLVRSDIYLESRMGRQIRITCGLLFIYSMTSYIESYLGNLSKLLMWRSILSFFNYSLTSMLLVSVIMIVYPAHKRYLFVPWAVNTICCAVSIPTGIVFRFTESNIFERGPIGYLPFIINGVYLVYLMRCILRNRYWEKNEFFLLAYMAATAFACLIMPLFFSAQTDQWLMLTIAIDMLVYYVFLLQQFTTRDPLTKLLNRQCYYAALEKHNMTALIAIDMNGLKQTNDSQGHAAGDKALRTLGDCFLRTVAHKHHVYRIGGDEFTILCSGADEETVKKLIERIENELAHTEYSCSFGYAMNEEGISVDELYHRADTMLYRNKQRYYAESGKDRRKDLRRGGA